MVTGRRIWQIVRNVFLVFLGLAAIFFLVVVPWFFTNLITHDHYQFPDPNNGKTPISYAMKFDWIQFHSKDGVLLKGWYVPKKTNPIGTIVYVHGLNRSRIEMLPMSHFAHGLGYNGLLFDLRNCGQSGRSVGTLGYNERWDVEAAIHYAIAKERATRPIVLWGVSMGAAAALEAAAHSADVGAVISDSSFLSLREVIDHHARLFLGLPSFPIPDEIIDWIAWRGGFKPSDFDLRKAVQHINPRPILFIAVAGDKRMPPSIARTLRSFSTNPLSRVVVVPGTRHGEGFNSGRVPYEQAVTEFLGAANPHSTPPAPSKPRTLRQEGKRKIRSLNRKL